tara:strand:- start:251 stop:652 length:402 start_codon:yes stop_codon:yes gene_type:complete
MKKYVFLFFISIFINQSVYSQITEYIELSTKGVFGRSEMVLYCHDNNYDDLEYLYIGRNNDNYHWVKYTGAKDIIIIMNDNENDTRELCYKHQSDEKATCKTVDAFASIYKLKAKENIFEVWISKINVKPNKS